MTDHHTFQHGPLEVRTVNFGPSGNCGCIEVRLNNGEILSVAVVDDPLTEAADLFKAFKQVYEAGVGDG